MATWPTEDKLHPSPASVNYLMHILLQLIVSPDPKTSSISFSSLCYPLIPKPTVYPSPAYIIPWSQNQQFILLQLTLLPGPKTNSLSFSSLHYSLIPKQLILLQPTLFPQNQQFILLQPTLSPDPQNNSLSFSSLHHPLIPKPTVYPSPVCIIYPMILKPKVYPSPACIIPWSQNQQYILLQPTSSPDPQTNSLSFSSLHHPLIPKQQFILLQPTLFPDPKTNSLSFSSLYYLSHDPKTKSLSFSSLHYPHIPKPTVYPSPAYIIPISQNQQFILLQHTSSPDPKTNRLSFFSLHYPLIPKPTVYSSPACIIYPMILKPKVYPSPACIIPWSPNQQYSLLQPTSSPDLKTNSLSFSSLHHPLIPKLMAYPSPVITITLCFRLAIFDLRMTPINQQIHPFVSGR